MELHSEWRLGLQPCYCTFAKVSFGWLVVTLNLAPISNNVLLGVETEKSVQFVGFLNWCHLSGESWMLQVLQASACAQFIQNLPKETDQSQCLDSSSFSALGAGEEGCHSTFLLYLSSVPDAVQIWGEKLGLWLEWCWAG